MWMSNIQVDGTQLALGSFDTKEEAAAAFDVAARHHFKEEAKCNFDMKLEDAVSADEARREAIQTRQLIHEGRIDLIKERAIHFKLWQRVFERRGRNLWRKKAAWGLPVCPYAMEDLGKEFREGEGPSCMEAYRRSGETGNDSGQGMLGCSVGSSSFENVENESSLE